MQDTAFTLVNTNMPQAIREYCRGKGQYVPTGMGEVACVVYESMVMKFKECMENVQYITKTSPQALHVFGGGIQNKMLCQWMADAMNIPVKAGPVETTSVGNLLMQMKAMGDISSIGEGRELSAKSSDVAEYIPSGKNEFEEHYQTYKRLLG